MTSSASFGRPTPITAATVRQQPSGMPVHKYGPYEAVDIPDRTWPDNRITKAPRWLSTDLRDGNQALIDPMSPARKREMFDLLVTMGYKEIEVGFPASGQTDFDFVRSIIEEGAIPDDVTISVLTQAREDLIERTVESLKGAQRATVHLYNATAPVFRRVVFRGSRDDSQADRRRRHPAGHGVRGEAAGRPDGLRLPVQPGDLHRHRAGLRAGGLRGASWTSGSPSPGREIILNLPATVERSTPSTHADRFEWMSPQPLPPRVRLPVRPPAQRPRYRRRRRRAGADGRRRPRRGLPVRAGRAHRQRRPGHPGHEPVLPGRRPADRLLRTSTRSVAPCEYCNQMEVHPRHPYAGDLVYTVLLRLPPGRHQEGLRRHGGARARAQGKTVDDIEWAVPYLPIDPKDVGRSYEAVIRVNSQSGKGGIAYVLKNDHKLDLPRRMQIEFSKIIQAKTDAEGGEVTPKRHLGDLPGRVPAQPGQPVGPYPATQRPVDHRHRRRGHAHRRGRGRRRRDHRAGRHRQRPDLGASSTRCRPSASTPGSWTTRSTR